MLNTMPFTVYKLYRYLPRIIVTTVVYVVFNKLINSNLLGNFIINLLTLNMPKRKCVFNDNFKKNF